MNYQKVYSLLVSSRKNNTTASSYHEKHHIKPRSMGGDDSDDNIVILTAREHLIAHKLLAKIHGGSMWVALSFMCHGRANSARGARVLSRTYENARKEMAKHYSTSMRGRANPNYGNNKVSGSSNGRHKDDLFEWQNKHTGKIIKCTRYEAYTFHGMDKVGVLSAISGSRKGVRDWTLLSEKCRPVIAVKKCRVCLEEKWINGFRKDKRLSDGFTNVCKLCYRDYENKRNASNNDHRTNKATS